MEGFLIFKGYFLVFSVRLYALDVTLTFNAYSLEWRIPDILESEVTLTHIFLLSFHFVTCYSTCYSMFGSTLFPTLVVPSSRSDFPCFIVILYSNSIVLFLLYVVNRFALSFSLLSIFSIFRFSASNIPFFTQQGIEIGIRVRGFILPKYYNLMLVSYIAYWIYRLYIYHSYA